MKPKQIVPIAQCLHDNCTGKQYKKTFWIGPLIAWLINPRYQQQQSSHAFLSSDCIRTQFADDQDSQQLYLTTHPDIAQTCPQNFWQRLIANVRIVITLATNN